MSEDAVSKAIMALAEVEAVGLPNYFDDQRFGSVGEPPEFVAKEMVLGHFERALWLALAAPYEFDRAGEQTREGTPARAMGRLARAQGSTSQGACAEPGRLPRSPPTDFKGAVARLRPELQGLYLSAYQSYLWNRMLAAWLTRALASTDRAEVELKLGRVPVPMRVPEERHTEWERLSLPLPSARVKPEPDAAWLPLAEEVLAGEGLTLAELKIKGMQKPFFSKGDRPGCVRVHSLSHDAGADELNVGRHKLMLRFDLPRGSYATMLVKRVTAVL